MPSGRLDDASLLPGRGRTPGKAATGAAMAVGLQSRDSMLRRRCLTAFRMKRRGGLPVPGTPDSYYMIAAPMPYVPIQSHHRVTTSLLADHREVKRSSCSFRRRSLPMIAPRVEPRPPASAAAWWQSMARRKPQLGQEPRHAAWPTWHPCERYRPRLDQHGDGRRVPQAAKDGAKTSALAAVASQRRSHRWWISW